MKQINVNDYVYVKLTEKAIQAHLQNDKLFWEEAYKTNPSTNYKGKTRKQFDEWHKQKDGFYKFQLWVFMKDFGGMFELGFDSPIQQSTFYFENKDVKDYDTES